MDRDPGRSRRFTVDVDRSTLREGVPVLVELDTDPAAVDEVRAAVVGIEGTSFALECAECGNTVTAEGESVRIEGTLYHFCCPSCAARFEERYAELERGAD